ncbi:phosphotransferase enzyme family protein [Flavihumibacter petaseus]|uniref:Aminoglycoside phosphotransferase domain-containing protein n=1 Tax=Flavihumibacter petaseus NBRC 106054 TaxID=1220578 RepID=A0A0E9N3E4_9BACT|nr:aminoglycoside phosphotransferase family protein [Flavihumibacter petaseus]GAO44487.1 hypothetical protein FPE01S_03_05240 [Flavihumibacter petaseus NBRC 106054]
MSVEAAAAQFQTGTFQFRPIGNGLINDTFQVDYDNGVTLVLQRINAHSFPQPVHILRNYQRMERWLEDHPGKTRIPRLCRTINGKAWWEDATGRIWRATGWIPNSSSPHQPDSMLMTANAVREYALFIRAFHGIDLRSWDIVIPQFHNLMQRYRQFENAMENAPLFRLMKATHVIASLRERSHYLAFYEEMILHPSDYPDRLQHHDCKVNNLLFNSSHDAVLAVADLDTVMPGKFFSDLGDMVRTMACTVSEESSEWEKVGVNIDRYEKILSVFKDCLDDILTPSEKAHLHEAGRLVTYMQALRYTTDFLQKDIYYKTSFPEQNLHRAFNQLILLERLEEIG